MKRATRLLAGAALVMVALLVAVVVAIATADWNRLRPTVNERVSAALGRPFAINGDLSVGWRRAADQPGWRGLLPVLQVSAADLRLGNPEWAASPGFAVFERVDFHLGLLPLLARRVLIPRIDVTRPAVWLERASDGRATWTFDQHDEPEGARWKLDIGEIAFDRGTLKLDDSVQALHLEAELTPLEAAIPFRDIVGKRGAADAEKEKEKEKEKDKDEDYGPAVDVDATPDYAFGWRVRGRYRERAFSGEGKTGGLLALHGNGLPFPVQADVRFGATRVVLAGALVDPRALAGFDLDLRLSGASTADLYPLTGVPLPDSPPYATAGRLSARLEGAEGASRFRYRNFTGRIGDSDIQGDLTYTSGAPRPSLQGELKSRLLRLADLGPLIGVGQTTNGDRPQPSDRVLPAAPFRTERWRQMDADVRFNGQRIERGEDLPFTDLQTHLRLNDGVLLLDPLQVGVAGGKVEGTVRLDGRKTPMAGRAQLQARRLSLKKLVPGFEPMQTSLGELNGEATLEGKGNSVAALLGSADGEFRVILDEGAISRGLMEIAGLNVGNYVVGKLFGDEEVKINCAVADFGMQDGVANSRLVLFDTENARVDLDGTVNFADERLDLQVRPQSKGGLRLLSLRSPLYVRGRFKAPEAGVQTGPLLARGAGMVALGVAVAPAAALLALVAPSTDRDNPCVPLLQQMKAENGKPARR